METQFNVNVKVDLAIDSQTQQFVRDLFNRSNKPTTTVDLPQPTIDPKGNAESTATEHKNPRSRVSRKAKEAEEMFARIDTSFSSIMEKAEMLSSEAGECYHNTIETALSKYGAKDISDLDSSHYSDFEIDLAEIEQDLDKCIAEAKEAKEKPTKQDQEGPKSTTTVDEISQLVKALMKKAKRLGEDKQSAVKETIKDFLSNYDAKNVNELDESHNDDFMKDLCDLDKDLDVELTKEEEPTKEEKEKPTDENITLDELSALFRPVMTTHREEIKQELKKLGAKNLAELDTDKYAEMKEFLISLK